MIRDKRVSFMHITDLKSNVVAKTNRFGFRSGLRLIVLNKSREEVAENKWGLVTFIKQHPQLVKRRVFRYQSDNRDFYFKIVRVQNKTGNKWWNPETQVRIYVTEVDNLEVVKRLGKLP